ncbi:amino acid permease [Fastidiosibacter lacustris]|uniref:amino acid permease n=1 Tax=Fastidiosibacter lacustris TaxID=2056695 RepID=UPI000E346B2A|nr:aromatic amino acid transport family protein [Fastidiosibacter lacustris]
MLSVSRMKQLGGILLIAGTSIGAGMLGIPYVVAAIGFKSAVVLLFINWIIMLATALLIVEVNIRQPLSADLNTMAYATLGRVGQFINWIAYLLLLYALTTAYISMGGSLLNQYVLHLSSSSGYGALLFTLLFGMVIYFGTSAVDQLNKVFFTLKTVCFIAIIVVVVPYVQTNLLESDSLGIGYAWYAFPILITSFGFHIVIPTIRNYFKNDQALKKIVIIGASVPFVVYVIWVAITLGVIPVLGNYGFQYLMKHNIDLGLAYHNLLNVDVVSGFIVGFSNVAVTTSFLGVTLALFHFNQDTYKLKKTMKARLVNFVITYVPPLIFAVFFVNGFLAALGYASIFVCILLIILPACMTWSLRQKEKRNGLLSKAYLLLLIVTGVFIVILQLLASIGLLAVLS